MDQLWLALDQFKLSEYQKGLGEMRRARLKVYQQIYLKMSVIFSPPFLLPTLEPGCITERLAGGTGLFEDLYFPKTLRWFLLHEKLSAFKEMNKEKEKKPKNVISSFHVIRTK